MLVDPRDMFAPYAGKLVTIAFSGGLDSTILAIEAINAGCNVQLIRFEAPTPTVSHEKRLAEPLQRALITHANRQRVKLTVDTKVVSSEIRPNASYQQMAWWLATLPMYIDENSVALAMGWVANDCTAHLAESFSQSIRATMATAYYTQVDVLFPILQWSKTMLLRRIEDYPEIAKHVWWCENGKTVEVKLDPVSAEQYRYRKPAREHRPCGKCHSCIDVMEYFTQFDGSRLDREEWVTPGSNMEALGTYPKFMYHGCSGIINDILKDVAKHFRVKAPALNMELCDGENVYHHVIANVELEEYTSALETLIHRGRVGIQYSRLIEQLTGIVLKHFGWWKNEEQVEKQSKVHTHLLKKIDVLFPVPDWMTKEIKNEVSSGSEEIVTELDVEKGSSQSTGTLGA